MDKIAKANPEFYVDELGSVSTERELDVVFGNMLKSGRDDRDPDHDHHPAVRVRLGAWPRWCRCCWRSRRSSRPWAWSPSRVSSSRVDEQISEVILLIGLAVGVDYSLFYIRREREERAAGRSERARPRSRRSDVGPGRARLRHHGARSRWPACSSPATRRSCPSRSGRCSSSSSPCSARSPSCPRCSASSATGSRRAGIPFVHRLRRKDGEGRFWGAILERVLRRPLVSAVAAAAVLVAMALPALEHPHGEPGIDGINIAEVEPVQEADRRLPRRQRARPVVAIRADDVRAEPSATRSPSSSGRHSPPAR